MNDKHNIINMKNKTAYCRMVAMAALMLLDGCHGSTHGVLWLPWQHSLVNVLGGGTGGRSLSGTMRAGRENIGDVLWRERGEGEINDVHC